MIDRPTLSVLMPTYNQAHYLAGALEAILAQTHRPNEIIVIDDGSTDGTAAILEDFARREPLIVLQRNDRNLGVLPNLKRLVDMASGDYFVGCASDDRVLPGFFEKSMAILSRYPQAGHCSGLSLIIDGQGISQGLANVPVVSNGAVYLPPRRTRRLTKKVGNWLQGNTIVYRRQALLDLGGFIPELRAFTDSFAALALALKHGCCFIPEPLGAWRWSLSGYAGVTKSDPVALREVIEHGRELMLTRYTDIFPRWYPDRWVEETRFQFAMSRYEEVEKMQESFLHDLTLVGDDPRVFRRLFAAASTTTKMMILLRHCHPRLVARTAREWSGARRASRSSAQEVVGRDAQ